jgi:hypothetical protein
MPKIVHQTNIPFKLGKRAPINDPRTLKFAKYIKKAAPPPPTDESWVLKVPSFPMMGNDTLGDCVIAAMGHMIQQWTYYASDGQHMITPTDPQILQAYEDVGGYVPGDPSTDNGCYMLEALNYWRKTGLGGHKILAYVSVDPTNITEVQQAVWLFGNLFAGLALPVSAQSQSGPGGKWTVPSGGLVGNGSPGSWGGHCVPLMGSSPYIHVFVTWAEVQKMTSNFRLAYMDEAYAVLSLDWIDVKGVSPSQFDLATLKQDLASL